MAVPGNLAVIWMVKHKIYFHNVLLIDYLCHTVSITNMRACTHLTELQFGLISIHSCTM